MDDPPATPLDLAQPAAPVEAVNGDSALSPQAGAGRAAPPASASAPSPAWTLIHRRALLWLLAVLCGGLAARYACTPAFIADPQPARSARTDRLADRLDPNTADQASLAALPGLGEKRAAAIIDYRTRRRKARPHEPPFQRLTDLLAVRGIGMATIESLEPYLLFPPPTTAPAAP